METIEERANIYVGHTKTMDDVETARLREAFLEGAKAQKEIDARLITDAFANLIATIGIVPRNINKIIL